MSALSGDPPSHPSPCSGAGWVGIAIQCVWLLSFLALASPHCVAGPSALWDILDGQCVPHMRAAKDPSPCAVADLAAGYVALKDRIGASQYLLMPIARIAGIESPEILREDSPNYWDHAWTMRRLTEARLGRPLPREALSLAINSVYGRTQNQLHIHIDCIRRDVRDALAAHRDAIDRYWEEFPVRFFGQTWRAFRIDGDTLGLTDPFRLLAHGQPAAAEEMGRHTLVLIGMTWSDGVVGFALLEGRASLSLSNRGSGEVLQDHDCAVAR